jgi:hypothetical protein
VTYPVFLLKLGLVLATCNPGMDPQEELWPADQEILNLQDIWQDHCRPTNIPESRSRLRVWEDTRRHLEEWVADARTIAVARYRCVLEDGADFCSSESEADNRERGDENHVSDMYTLGMSDEEGKPVFYRTRTTEDQANRLQNRGRAGGSDTASGAGRSE